jgi:hypothetical protein
LAFAVANKERRVKPEDKCIVTVPKSLARNLSLYNA